MSPKIESHLEYLLLVKQVEQMRMFSISVALCYGSTHLCTYAVERLNELRIINKMHKFMDQWVVQSLALRSCVCVFVCVHKRSGSKEVESQSECDLWLRQ